MKPRHAAALALVGWYLMLPPLTYSFWSGWHIDSEAALGEWRIFSSYDSAEACGRDMQIFQSFWEQTSKERPTEKGAKLDAEQAPFAVCIASDDPRLKEK